MSIAQIQKEKLDSMIKEFSKDKDIIKIVNQIEHGMKTTQYNYGRYLQFLTPYAKDKTALYIISEALKLAGGNIQGIQSAIKILIG